MIPEDFKNKPYLTPTEVAQWMMVSPITVRGWAQKGLLKAEVTPGGHRRFRLEEVARFARQWNPTGNKGPLRLRIGAVISVMLDLPSDAFETDGLHDSFVWDDAHGTAQFEVTCLRGAELRRHACKAVVNVDGRRTAILRFQLNVVARPLDSPPVSPPSECGGEGLVVADVLRSLGRLSTEMSLCGEAMEQFERALAIEERACRPARAADTLNEMGKTLRLQKKGGEALAAFERALGIKEEHYGRDHVKVAATLRDMAPALHEAGKVDEAIRRLRT